MRKACGPGWFSLPQESGLICTAAFSSSMAFWSWESEAYVIPSSSCYFKTVGKHGQKVLQLLGCFGRSALRCSPPRLTEIADPDSRLQGSVALRMPPMPEEHKQPPTGMGPTCPQPTSIIARERSAAQNRVRKGAMFDAFPDQSYLTSEVQLQSGTGFAADLTDHRAFEPISPKFGVEVVAESRPRLLRCAKVRSVKFGVLRI